MVPALRKAFDQHRDERAQELFDIASILDQVGLTPDNGPILQAAAQCRSAPKTVPTGQPDAGRQYWGFEIADFRINLDNQRHLRPRTAVMDQCVGVLSIVLQEYVPDKENDIGRSYELLRQSSVDFHLDAFQQIDGVRHNLRAAWHIDTHFYVDTPSHGAHPRFHFQVGGERLDEIDASIRGVLMPETPRMPCAPLDAILALDLVLAHYCGEQWNLLKDLVPSYFRLRKNPLQRYWSPYFRTLADGIDGLDTITGGGDACILIPNIFCG
jgi:hypothetical protein